MAPPDVAALGIARTFQNVALFKGMSVLYNIMTGRLLKMRGSFLLEALYWGPARRQELEHRAFVERIIDFLEIQAIRKFFFSSRRRHTRCLSDWSSDVCSSD